MSTDSQIELFVKGLREQLNIAFAAALDDKNDFTYAYRLIREPVDALKQFKCESIAAEQLMNFAQMAYARREAGYAVECLLEADELVSEEQRPKFEELRCNMGIDLLARAIPGKEQALLDTVSRILTAQDYLTALDLAKKQADDAASEKETYTIFLRGLAMEMLRRGVEAQKAGDYEKAAVLMVGCLPYLSSKRAEAVKQQLAKWGITV